MGKEYPITVRPTSLFGLNGQAGNWMAGPKACPTVWGLAGWPLGLSNWLDGLGADVRNFSPGLRQQNKRSDTQKNMQSLQTVKRQHLKTRNRPTDGRTDGQTDRLLQRDSCARIKNEQQILPLFPYTLSSTPLLSSAIFHLLFSDSPPPFPPSSTHYRTTPVPLQIFILSKFDILFWSTALYDLFRFLLILFSLFFWNYEKILFRGLQKLYKSVGLVKLLKTK